MAAIKIIILCGLIAVAFGFTIPEQQEINQEQVFGDDTPFEDAEILTRVARSPQRNIQTGMQHSTRHGTSAQATYNHPISRNVDAYATAQRNFKYNDNSGHVGLRYKF